MVSGTSSLGPVNLKSVGRNNGGVEVVTLQCERLEELQPWPVVHHQNTKHTRRAGEQESQGLPGSNGFLPS